MAGYNAFRCPYCGHSVIKVTTFCENCGKRVALKWILVPAEKRTRTIPKRMCPNCEEEVHDENIKFCGKCGGPIVEKFETTEENLKGSSRGS